MNSNINVNINFKNVNDVPESSSLSNTLRIKPFFFYFKKGSLFGHSLRKNKID